MPLTYGNLIAKLRPLIWPTSEAPNLVPSHDQSFIDCLDDLQTWVECLQVDHYDLFPQCATLYNCGLTMLEQPPHSMVKKLSVIDKQSQMSSGTVTASKAGAFITASANFFDASMVGAIIKFANGQSFVVADFIDATSLSVEDTLVVISDETFTVIGQNGPASILAPDDWCSEIVYHEVDICHIHAYLNASQRRGCCYPPALFFGLSPSRCGKGMFPVPTDAGVSKSLPVLPLGFHYGQESTNRRHGRACEGVWAKERGKIYIAPWMQNSETAVLEWDGKKRTWVTADPIDDDPLLHEAMVQFARWQHEDKWNKDPQAAASAAEAYATAKAKLMRQCREETRVRRCEPSVARSSPGTLYYNQEQSATASCPSGQIGDPITQVIPANSVASQKSVADANAIAQKQAVDQANARLICTTAPVTYWNTAQTAIATCAQTQGAPIPDGDPVTRTIPAHSFSSTTSQAATDALAMAEAERLANLGLSCIWWNAAQPYTASCPEGSTGSDVTVTTPEHTNSSSVSQADADATALAAAKLAAEDGLVCTGSPTIYKNTEQIVQEILHGCQPHRDCNVTVTVTVRANFFSSTISQADANQNARNYGSSFAATQALLKCGLNLCGFYTFTIP